MLLETVEFSSPLGSLKAAIHADRVHALGFADHWPRLAALLRARLGDVAFKQMPGHPPIICSINDYFAGDLAALDAVPVRLTGTPFQQKVWAALQRIPAGKTLSYGALARKIDAPGAARGVGSACNANVIWLAVPCHRVVGADGGLTGYAGGIERKHWLLAHERAQHERGRVVAPLPADRALRARGSRIRPKINVKPLATTNNRAAKVAPFRPWKIVVDILAPLQSEVRVV